MSTPNQQWRDSTFPEGAEFIDEMIKTLAKEHQLIIDRNDPSVELFALTKVFGDCFLKQCSDFITKNTKEIQDRQVTIAKDVAEKMLTEHSKVVLEDFKKDTERMLAAQRDLLKTILAAKKHHASLLRKHYIFSTFSITASMMMPLVVYLLLT